MTSHTIIPMHPPRERIRGVAGAAWKGAGRALADLGDVIGGASADGRGRGVGSPSLLLPGRSSTDVNLADLARRASTRWPRLYRPPRVRGGHVILDLCVHERVLGSEDSVGLDEREMNMNDKGTMQGDTESRKEEEGGLPRATREGEASASRQDPSSSFGLRQGAKAMAPLPRRPPSERGRLERHVSVTKV